MSSKLKPFRIKDFSGGYNSFLSSKTDISDNEIPYGQNCEVDETFTSFQKVGGSKRVSEEVAEGYAVKHLHIYKKADGSEEEIAISGAVVRKTLPDDAVLSGFTPTADLDYTSFNGDDSNAYFFNGTDNPFYYDGSDLTEITSDLPTNGCGTIAINYSRSAYVRNKTDLSRLDFSGMYYPESAEAPDNFMNFTSGASVYGGYLRFPQGQVITCLYETPDGMLVGTKEGNIYKCVPDGDTGLSNARSHSIQMIVKGTGVSSIKSIFQVGNDVLFFFNKGYYSLGYQQLFGNILRASVLSKKVTPEFTNVNKEAVSAIFFNDYGYIAYGNTHNNRAMKLAFRDKNYQISAWSTPIVGWNVHCWEVYTDSDGVKHLHGGSSLNTDSYVYEYDTGTDNNGEAIDAFFEIKSTDCKLPGIMKYFAFLDAPYSMIYGVVDYEVFLDEVSSITGKLSVGNSQSKPAGSGSLPSGTKASGMNIDPNTTFASLKQNDRLPIDCGFEPGKTITVRFSNNNLGESFKINGAEIYFQPGDVWDGRN